MCVVVMRVIVCVTMIGHTAFHTLSHEHAPIQTHTYIMLTCAAGATAASSLATTFGADSHVSSFVSAAGAAGAAGAKPPGTKSPAEGLKPLACCGLWVDLRE